MHGFSPASRVEMMRSLTACQRFKVILFFCGDMPKAIHRFKRNASVSVMAFEVRTASKVFFGMNQKRNRCMPKDDYSPRHLSSIFQLQSQRRRRHFF